MTSAEFFVELVSAAWGTDDDDFAWLVCQVEERVRHAGGKIGEASFVEDEGPLPDLDLVAALEGVERFFLLVVDVWEGPSG